PCDASTSRRRPGHHRLSRSTARVPSAPPPSRRQDLTDLHPWAARSTKGPVDSQPDLRRAVEVRGIHHRAIHSFRASKSGETLPKFRQKSKGNLKRI
ncbi:hypothetical protein Prudu_002484, partial [Prunus dulcis]